MSNEFKEGLKVGDLKPIYDVNDVEQEMLYKEFVDMQKGHFISYMNFLNAELCVLKHYGIVSDYTRFLARIKSTESAIKNDREKTLNDAFGVEVASGTPGEFAFTAMLFMDTLKETKESVKNRTNKYVAHHYSGYPKVGNIVERLEEILDKNKIYNPKEMFDSYMAKLPVKVKEDMSPEDLKKTEEYFESFCNNLNSYKELINESLDANYLKSLKKDLKVIEQEYHKAEKLEKNSQIQPIIEGQFKTIQTSIEANRGTASHESYKGEDIKTIQREYNKNGGLPLSKLPIMWRSTLDTYENGKAIPPRLLSSDETARVLYPLLIVKKKGEKEIG